LLTVYESVKPAVQGNALLKTSCDSRKQNLSYFISAVTLIMKHSQN